MEELKPAPEALSPSPADKDRGRLLRVALALSVALNLGVAGLIVGTTAKIGGLGMHGDFVHDLGFGPFTEALNPEERQTLRHAFLARAPELRSTRRQRRADLDGLLAALRSEPFDEAGLVAQMEAQSARLTGRIAIGQALMLDFLIEMEPAARHDFADRLESRMRHGHGGEAG